MAAAQPVTNDTNEDLTDDDTANLKVVDSLCPDFVTDVERLPACRKRSLQKRPDITDREENVAATR